MELNEEEIKAAFSAEFSDSYLDSLTNRCSYEGGDLSELLYMAFATGFAASERKLENK